MMYERRPERRVMTRDRRQKFRRGPWHLQVGDRLYERRLEATRSSPTYIRKRMRCESRRGNRRDIDRRSSAFSPVCFWACGRRLRLHVKHLEKHTPVLPICSITTQLSFLFYCHTVSFTFLPVGISKRLELFFYHPRSNQGHGRRLRPVLVQMAWYGRGVCASRVRVDTIECSFLGECEPVKSNCRGADF